MRGSHCWRSDTLEALSDGVEPSASDDHSIPRHTFWDHRGTREWLGYEWETRMRVSTASVYWFDDTGRGACKVPKSWRLLWNDGDEWKPVELVEGGYGVERDRYNEIRFTPVRTAALRLEVELQERWSGGVLEWKVDAKE